MIDKSDGRDWEKEAAEAVICLNCTKPKCNGTSECFKAQAKRHKPKKSGGNSGNAAVRNKYFPTIKGVNNE